MRKPAVNRVAERTQELKASHFVAPPRRGIGVARVDDRGRRRDPVRHIHKHMQFLRHQRHFLLVLAVLVVAAVMVGHQQLTNQSAHVARLEDFIRLHERGAMELAAHRYQRLVQELPHLNEASLVGDLNRTTLLVPAAPPQIDNLIWKYRVGVENELNRRANLRLGKLLQNNPN
jgi:hypothetical protein